MHDGTVRDVCFIEDTTNKSSLLVSGGAGDCKIYVTDCATGQAFQALSGHSGKLGLDGVMINFIVCNSLKKNFILNFEPAFKV